MSGFRCGLVASFTDQHAFFPRVHFLRPEFIMKKKGNVCDPGFSVRGTVSNYAVETSVCSLRMASGL